MDVTETPSGGQGAAEPPLQPPELGSFAPARHDAVETTSEQAPKTDPTTGLAALLNNRFILGGLGIVVVLLLTAIVLVAIGHGDDSDAGSQNVAAAPDNEETPTRPIGGLAGTTTMTASYRNGPGPRFVILGTIPRGVTVAIVGRSEDSTWLQVRYPPGSSLKGWVDANLLEVEGDVTVLVVAGPGPVASAGATSGPTVVIYEPVATPTTEPLEPTEVLLPPSPAATRRPTVTPYRMPSATPVATAEDPPTQTVQPPPPVQ